MNVIFMQPLHQSFQSVTNSLCGETVNASRPDLIQKLILIRAKKGAHGVLAEHYLNKAITWPYCTD